jgi:hypothetical protein
MVWPIAQQANTENLEESTSSPSLARQDLYTALTLLNSAILSANEANGAVVTDSFNKIAAQQIPNNLNMTGNIALQPGTGWVTVSNVLNIAPQTVAQLEANERIPELGDVIVVLDADAGAPAVCFYDGENWRKLPFSTLSVL